MSMKEDKPELLFLVHRIPFPPNKGDKIRSFNMLKALSTHYNVHLATFVDDPDDEKYVEQLSNWCSSFIAKKQSKLISKLKALSGFVTNRAISLPYYSDRAVSCWIEKKIHEQHITRCLVFSGAMAQFIEPFDALLKASVIDFVDVDSDKWFQYSQNKKGIKSWFYKREARLLAKYEQSIAAQASASCFVSDDEAKVFNKHLPLSHQSKVFGIRNGVDTDYFSPSADVTEKIITNSKSIVFTGAMDYWANINAVVWFIENVWPSILLTHSDAVFYVVGAKPSSEVLQYNGLNNIVVTGRVEDVRPYIAQARLSVAPLQIARGIQNKVLEALAMARPLVLTGMAAEGINSNSQVGYWIEDKAEKMAQQISKILNNEYETSFPSNREFVQVNFSWESEMLKFKDLLEQGVQQ